MGAENRRASAVPFKPSDITLVPLAEKPSYDFAEGNGSFSDAAKFGGELYVGIRAW